MTCEHYLKVRKERKNTIWRGKTAHTWALQNSKSSGGYVEVANIAMRPGNFVLQLVSFSLQQARRNVSLSKGWWPYATLFAYFFFLFLRYSHIHIQHLLRNISISSQLHPNAQWMEPPLGPEIRSRACHPASQRTTIWATLYPAQKITLYSSRSISLIMV